MKGNGVQSSSAEPFVSRLCLFASRFDVWKSSHQTLEAHFKVVKAALMQVLILQLRRAHWDGLHGLVKLRGYVKFPLVLDLQPHTWQIDTSLSAKPDQSSKRSTDISAGHSTRMLYALTAVVVHIEMGRQGHYYVYRRGICREAAAEEGPSSRQKEGSRCSPPLQHGSNGEAGGMTGYSWWLVSDQDSRPCTTQEVLASQATLLFYERT